MTFNCSRHRTEAKVCPPDCPECAGRGSRTIITAEEVANFLERTGGCSGFMEANRIRKVIDWLLRHPEDAKERIEWPWRPPEETHAQP